MDKDWTTLLQEIKVELLFLLLLMAILFYQFQKAEVKTLMSLLLITIWGIFIWYYLQYRVKQEKQEGSKADTLLNKEHDIMMKNPEINSSYYPIKGAPKKGWTYLKENTTLIQIAKDLDFVKTFDRQKYQWMLVQMNQYQKVYMYILAERYPCQSYIGNFIDIREGILEVLYQMYLVVPSHFKHIYGVHPYEVLKNNIETFIKLSRTMIEVLENFCRMDLKEYYFPMTQPMPNDIIRKVEKQNILP
jgi:Ca2+/Na+ antiporter